MAVTVISRPSQEAYFLCDGPAGPPQGKSVPGHLQVLPTVRFGSLDQRLANSLSCPQPNFNQTLHTDMLGETRIRRGGPHNRSDLHTSENSMKNVTATLIVLLTFPAFGAELRSVFEDGSTKVFVEVGSLARSATHARLWTTWKYSRSQSEHSNTKFLAARRQYLFNCDEKTMASLESHYFSDSDAAHEVGRPWVESENNIKPVTASMREARILQFACSSEAAPAK